MTLVLRYAARSDRGLVRANNEDSVYAGARLLALADGMGGHAAGEVASQLVIAALAHLDDDEPGGDLLAKLDAAVHAGNSAIAAQVEMEPDLEGMGTTLTAILFAGNRLGLVHIGDSRGYLLRDGELTQITKDDTFVQTLVDEGPHHREEAHSHPQRSLIMRALTGHEVEPTLTMREVRAGDRYLLCSDGLSDPVSDETILDALQIPDVTDSADRLIELALRGGGPDNVTVVVADVVDYDYGQTQPIIAGAVSGDDDQTDPAQHLGRPRLGHQPARRGRQTRCAASRNRRPGPGGRGGGWSIGVALVVLLVLAALAIGRTIIRSNYYVAEYNGAVSIMQGIQGSLLGMPLHQPYLVGCLNTRNQLSVISYGQAGGDPDCQLMKLHDLAQPARAQVAGRTSGRHPGPGRSRSCGNCRPTRCCRPARRRARLAARLTGSAATSGTPGPGATTSPPTTSPPSAPLRRSHPATPSAATRPAAPVTATVARRPPADCARTAAAPPQPGTDCRAVA